MGRGGRVIFLNVEHLRVRCSKKMYINVQFRYSAYQGSIPLNCRNCSSRRTDIGISLDPPRKTPLRYLSAASISIPEKFYRDGRERKRDTVVSLVVTRTNYDALMRHTFPPSSLASPAGTDLDDSIPTIRAAEQSRTREREFRPD